MNNNSIVINSNNLTGENVVATTLKSGLKLYIYSKKDTVAQGRFLCVTVSFFMFLSGIHYDISCK